MAVSKRQQDGVRFDEYAVVYGDRCVIFSQPGAPRYYFEGEHKIQKATKTFDPLKFLLWNIDTRPERYEVLNIGKYPCVEFREMVIDKFRYDSAARTLGTLLYPKLSQEDRVTNTRFLEQYLLETKHFEMIRSNVLKISPFEDSILDPTLYPAGSKVREIIEIMLTRWRNGSAA